MDAGWASALEPVVRELAGMTAFLAAERAAGRPYLPADDVILRVFDQPFADVRVVIVGQDPYPIPGHAVGLSFSVDRHVLPLPLSLQNIYREFSDDLGIEPPGHGDLTGWTERGVMLLNRCLTVRPKLPGSHRGAGWKAITDAAIHALVDREKPLIAILWGSDAQRLRPLLGGTPFVASAHPSPRTAHRGFFGSRPFSRANALLTELGAAAIDWTLA